MDVDIYVGLGSNIEPERHLRDALETLEAKLGPLEASGVYRGPPIGFEGDDFLNLVVRFRSNLAPEAIAALLSEIESAAGRTRCRGSIGPRTLDLDLLLHGRRVDPRRRLPRPDVLRYPFVLAPLAELAPTLTHPLTGERMAEAWRDMRSRGVALVRVHGIHDFVD